MLIHAAQLSLSGSEALVRGLAIPEQSLTVVLGSAEAAIIVVREGKLRPRVPRSGGKAKSRSHRSAAVLSPGSTSGRVPELAPRKAVRT